MKKTKILKLIGIIAVCLVTYTLLGQPFIKVQTLAIAVSAPNVITVTTTSQTALAASEAREVGRVVSRTIQNTGTVAVIYAIDATPTTSSYHGIIAPGAVARDGLGSVVEFSRTGGAINVITESGTSTIAVVELTQ